MSTLPNEILTARTIRRPIEQQDHVPAGKQENVTLPSTYLTPIAYEMEEHLGDYSNELY